MTSPRDRPDLHGARVLRLVRHGTHYCEAPDSFDAPEEVVDSGVWRYLFTRCDRREAEVERHGHITRDFVHVPHHDGDAGYVLVFDEDAEDSSPPEGRDDSHANDRYLAMLHSRLSRYDGIGSSAPFDLQQSYVRPGLSLRESEHSRPRQIECEQLADLRRTLVIGSAGAGKTSLLRWVALAAAERHDAASPGGTVPIYVETRKLTQPRFDLDTLRHILTRENGSEIAQRLEDLVANGDVLLIVDGLDEMIDTERPAFVRSIDALEAEFPNLRIIISSRPVGIPDGLEDFARVDVLPFSDEQIAEWTWLRQPSARLWSEFTDQLATSQAIREMTANPLMLTVVWNLFSQRAALPREHGSVLNELTDTLCEGWDAGRGVRRTDEWRNRKLLFTSLCRLSFDLASRDQDAFGVDDVERSLNWVITINWDRTIESLAERSAILQPVGYQRWAFTHRALQESLAARFAVASASDATTYLHGLLRAPQGQRIWLNACGTALDADRLLREMLATDDVDECERAVLLARALDQGAAAAPELLTDCAQRVVDALGLVLSNGEVHHDDPDDLVLMRFHLPTADDAAIASTARLLEAVLNVGRSAFRTLLGEMLLATDTAPLQALAGIRADATVFSVEVDIEANGPQTLVVSRVDAAVPSAPSTTDLRTRLQGSAERGGPSQAGTS